jgi:hypothetical protein
MHVNKLYTLYLIYRYGGDIVLVSKILFFLWNSGLYSLVNKKQKKIHSDVVVVQDLKDPDYPDWQLID